MEFQVNVSADGGEKVKGTTASGHSWTGFTDGKETWKGYRVPWQANTIPIYRDSEMSYSTGRFEAIGLTGWNWVKRTSVWLGFDFDSIVGHRSGLSDDELGKVRAAVEAVPWVTVRKSTSGKGLHLYIFLDPHIPTATHTEHAALARAVLGLLSARVGHNLQGKVDTCGGVLWFWHRRMAKDGYSLLRAGSALGDVPVNWHDYAEPLTATVRRRAKPPVPDGEAEALEELVNRTKTAPLDDQHKILMGWLAENNAYWWWDSDRGMLVCHTYDVQEAHKALRFKGPFYTVSIGKDRGRDQNCFLFPLRNGSWVVRRHTRRTMEHPAWSVDGGGWTRCYLNCPASFTVAARCHGAVERPDGRFEVSTVEAAMGALRDLGGIPFEVEEHLKKRPALLREHKDGRAVLSAQLTATDTPPTGWSKSKDGTCWERLVDIQNEEPEVEVPDDFIRHLVAGGQDAGWYIFTRSNWTFECEGNIRKALTASGVSAKSHQLILGQCVLHPWYLVCRPFQAEYPGNRSWNRRAPQLSHEPAEGEWPTWRMVLDHCGVGLQEAVEASAWCREFGVARGGDYLLLWAASVLQHPGEPLPYLFFYGPQNSGKTTFHEALGLLCKDRVGYVRADVALTSQSRFNAELANAVLCVVEETNLQQSKDAYARVKDWVTSRSLLVHEKGKTPYELPNNTHWVQTANEIDAMPAFSGDSRIVMGFVDVPAQVVPKSELMAKLEVEAPAFIWALTHAEVPKSNERLRVPVITTAAKMEMEAASENPVHTFFARHLHPVAGNVVPMQDVYDRFFADLPVGRRGYWTYERFRKKVPDTVTRGKWGTGGFYHVANMSWDKATPAGRPLKRVLDRITEDYV